MPSFNVQNAKSLEITEGEVKIIQDSDDKQLWGKLNYTTKYEGDIEQTTLTGKNLFNINSLAQGSITVTDGVATGTAGQFYTEFGSGGSGIDFINPNEQITLSLSAYTDGNASTSGNGLFFSIHYTDDTYDRIYYSNNTEQYLRKSLTSDVAKTVSKITITYSSSTNNIWYIKEFQIEKGSQATDWEQFVGGIASPNPNYPQPISVVTGTQTLTLTDAGGNTEDFTVSLGSTELCEIDTYQDYIYKSEGNWYKHAEIEKVSFDGSEQWTKLNNAFQTAALTPETHIGLAYSDYFTYYPTQVAITSTIPNGQFGWNTSKVPTFRNDTCADAPAFKTWLSTHNTTVYYQLATATDTQITNADLIAQLDAIEEWLTRCGYTATVNGSLPIIINQTEIV